MLNKSPIRPANTAALVREIFGCQCSSTHPSFCAFAHNFLAFGVHRHSGQVGTFVVSFTTEVSRTFNFVPRQAFLFKLKKAYNQKESPLTKQLTKNLEDKLVTEYRAERGEL